VDDSRCHTRRLDRAGVAHERSGVRPRCPRARPADAAREQDHGFARLGRARGCPDESAAVGEVLEVKGDETRALVTGELVQEVRRDEVSLVAERCEAREAETRCDREARELERQKAWLDQASRAMQSYKADEGTAPVNADDLEPADELASLPLGAVEGERGETVLEPGGAPLPTLRVLPQGISRKRLEQAVRDLGLPVVIARDVDEADVVMTLKNEYKQKTPLLREAEERAMPIYVLKSNTIPQMQSSLTSIFSLEIDPREAALRETEDAIEVVLTSSEAVELSPQNAYIRRLQHQMAERANLVSRSRGREPFRRVRLYPDAARSTWR
jgi:hypothetical protein